MTKGTDTRPIVVGVDGSRFGRAALRWALAEGARRRCAVRALLVAHRAPVIAAGRPTTIGLGVALSGTANADYLRPLEETVHSVLGEHDDPRLTAEVIQGSPPETLCAAAGDAQLLVVGSHGHGQLFQAVLGSVAQYCVRHATCPVVVIPRGLAGSMSEADEPARPESFHPAGPGL